ncbi:hypothetical protein SO694_00028022 [Aureococcus anophagefferens]|uniref:AP2/ERF domain-containing protein n=1 Tax=Aureococcus anophagefferens TaxID=44056 RepID=A0ABR1FVB8_AURAN
MKVKTPKPPPKRPAPNESAAPAEKRRGPRRGLREPIRPARAPRRGAPRQAAARGSRRLSDDFSVVGVHAADSPLVKVVLAYVDVDDFEDSSPLAAARYLVRPGGPPVPEHVAAACRVLIGGSNSAAKRAAKRVLESAAEGEESLADAARRLADGGELDALETTACAWAAENPLVASAAPSTATFERRRAGEVQAARAAAVKEKPPYQTQTRSDRFQASFKWTSDPRLESRMICVGTWDTPEEAATAVHCALLRIEEPDKYANLLKHPCVAKLNLSETTTHSEKVHRIVDKAFTKRRKEDAKAIAALAAQSAGAAPSAQDKPPECDSKRKCLSLIQKCEPVFNRKRKGDASSLPQDYCVLCAARNAANKSASTARRNKHKARA